MPKEVGHDGKGGGGSEMGGSPERVDDLETVCRRMNLAGTPVTPRGVLVVDEVLKTVNDAKDNVTDADILLKNRRKSRASSVIAT